MSGMSTRSSSSQHFSTPERFLSAAQRKRAAKHCRIDAFLEEQRGGPLVDERGNVAPRKISELHRLSGTQLSRKVFYNHITGETKSGMLGRPPHASMLVRESVYNEATAKALAKQPLFKVCGFR